MSNQRKEIDTQLSKAQRVPLNFEDLEDKMYAPDGLFAQMKIICQPQASREAELIQHIKHLQNALNMVIPYLPTDSQDFVISTIGNSKEFVKIAES